MVSTGSLYKTLQRVPFCTYLGGYPTKLEEVDWSPGFFEETFGTWEGEPLIRASQGEITEWQPFV